MKKARSTLYFISSVQLTAISFLIFINFFITFCNMLFSDSWALISCEQTSLYYSVFYPVLLLTLGFLTLGILNSVFLSKALKSKKSDGLDVNITNFTLITVFSLIISLISFCCNILTSSFSSTDAEETINLERFFLALVLPMISIIVSIVGTVISKNKFAAGLILNYIGLIISLISFCLVFGQTFLSNDDGFLKFLFSLIIISVIVMTSSFILSFIKPDFVNKEVNIKEKDSKDNISK